jgi:hypothetical protein
VATAAVAATATAGTAAAVVAAAATVAEIGMTAITAGIAIAGKTHEEGWPGHLSFFLVIFAECDGQFTA